MCVLVLGCGGRDDGRDLPWNPSGDDGAGRPDVDAHETEGADAGDEDSGSPTSGAGDVCEPGEAGDCLCDDGLSLGTQTCADDGSGWGPCLCDDSDDGGTTTDDPVGTDGGDETTTGPTDNNEVCYPGADLAYTTCFELHVPDSPPAGYDYPPALNGDPNYREPIAYLDLESADENTMLARTSGSASWPSCTRGGGRWCSRTRSSGCRSCATR